MYQFLVRRCRNEVFSATVVVEKEAWLRIGQWAAAIVAASKYATVLQPAQHSSIRAGKTCVPHQQS